MLRRSCSLWPCFFAFSGMANIAQQNARYAQSELVFPAMRLTKSRLVTSVLPARSILLGQYRNIINAETIIKKDEEEGIATE
jgi:hypothetical protein